VNAPISRDKGNPEFPCQGNELTIVRRAPGLLGEPQDLVGIDCILPAVHEIGGEIHHPDRVIDLQVTALQRRCLGPASSPERSLA
jgi:hypothetical protein